jgi:hypothetical protein
VHHSIATVGRQHEVSEKNFPQKTQTRVGSEEELLTRIGTLAQDQVAIGAQSRKGASEVNGVDDAGTSTVLHQHSHLKPKHETLCCRF